MTQQRQQAAQTQTLSTAPSGLLQRQCACGQHTVAGEECEECKKKQLQRKAANQTDPKTVPAIVHEVLHSPGQPLDVGTRAFTEPRFGHDFSGVRVHTDAKAAESARAINALAYTVGRDVVFGVGQYAPRTGEGQRLLVHELTHTIQQGNRPPMTQIQSSAVAEVSSQLELEADTVAQAVLHNVPPHINGVSAINVQRQHQSAARRQTETCTTTYRPARSFRQLIDLVRIAEAKLIACGYTTPDERIHLLRGIYYGTTWSADYMAERSGVRNLGFQVYTASSTPADPRGCLTCGLFYALRQSQDITDGRRRVDFGHLLIGMDARRSTIARNIAIPSQGATGLAIATWVGDLGGGAAMLSVARATNPRRLAVDFFRGSDFGGSINLEGDLAGYLVAADPASPNTPAAPVISPGSTIAGVLESYLLPSRGAAGTNWGTRCQSFLRMMGGTLSTSGTITNRAAVIASMTRQIEAFACWYLVNRLRQTGRLSLSTLRGAASHVSGAAQEVATVFIDALEYCATHPGSALEARGSGPTPSPAGTPSGACQTAITTMERIEQVRKRGRDLERRTREFGEDVMEGLSGLRRRLGL